MLQLATKNEFSLLPTTFAEAEKFANIICNSSFCPAPYRGKPNDVLIAIQMGHEVGLKAHQAVQNIVVINGKPSIYGDAMLALCRIHPDFEWIEEEITETYSSCAIKRKGNNPITCKFTMEDAKRAGLWEKNGPWSTYPKRMLQMRARAFALRDSFPDALKGLITVEEAQDYPVEKNITPKKSYKSASMPTQDITEYVEEDIDMEPKKAASSESLNQMMDFMAEIEDDQERDILLKKWLKAANVKIVTELTQDKVDACINFLKLKREKGNVNTDKA